MNESVNHSTMQSFRKTVLKGENKGISAILIQNMALFCFSAQLRPDTSTLFLLSLLPHSGELQDFFFHYKPAFLVLISYPDDYKSVFLTAAAAAVLKGRKFLKTPTYSSDRKFHGVSDRYFLWYLLR